MSLGEIEIYAYIVLETRASESPFGARGGRGSSDNNSNNSNRRSISNRNLGHLIFRQVLSQLLTVWCFNIRQSL